MENSELESLYNCPDLCKNKDIKCMQCVESSHYKPTKEVEKLRNKNTYGANH